MVAAERFYFYCCFNWLKNKKQKNKTKTKNRILKNAKNVKMRQ